MYGIDSYTYHVKGGETASVKVEARCSGRADCSGTAIASDSKAEAVYGFVGVQDRRPAPFETSNIQ